MKAQKTVPMMVVVLALLKVHWWVEWAEWWDQRWVQRMAVLD